MVVDDGLLIPCIDLITREKLFLHAASYGFSEQRRVDMVGRNTSDMVFQLIGGSSRLVVIDIEINYVVFSRFMFITDIY